MKKLLGILVIIQHVSNALLMVGAFLEAGVQSDMDYAPFAWTMLGISSLAWVARNVIDDLFSKPNLIFSKPYIETHSLSSATTSEDVDDAEIAARFGSTTSTPVHSLRRVDVHLGEYEFAIVRITNKPKIETLNSDAMGVTATATAYTLEEHAVIQPTRAPIFLRWWDKPETPTAGETYRQLRSTNIEVHNPVELGIAFKRKGFRDVYLYDVEMHDPKQVGFVRTGTLLGSEPRFVRVELKGKIPQCDEWYQIYSQDDKLFCIRVEKPKGWKERK